jgi:hypothetical protein
MDEVKDASDSSRIDRRVADETSVVKECSGVCVGK